MSRGLEHLSYEDGLRDIGPYSSLLVPRRCTGRAFLQGDVVRGQGGMILN